MGYSSFGLGPCLAEGVLCFELCEQRLTPPMSNRLFSLAGIKRCIFSVFLLGFRTFYPFHILQPHKISLRKRRNSFSLFSASSSCNPNTEWSTRRKLLSDPSESTLCPEAEARSSALTHELP